MMENFLIALQIMAQGMGGIFVVIILITLVVMLMGKINRKRECFYAPLEVAENSSFFHRRVRRKWQETVPFFHQK